MSSSCRPRVVKFDKYSCEVGFAICSSGTLDDDAMTSVSSDTSARRDVLWAVAESGSSILRAYI